MAIEDRAHINDIHATILHLMGLDHKQLTFLHNGRDERLTDVGGHVHQEAAGVSLTSGRGRWQAVDEVHGRTLVAIRHLSMDRRDQEQHRFVVDSPGRCCTSPRDVLDFKCAVADASTAGQVGHGHIRELFFPISKELWRLDLC